MTISNRSIVLITRATVANGGCTFDDAGNMHSGSSGYVVSPYPEFTEVHNVADKPKSYIFGLIRWYVSRHYATVVNSPNHYFGTWLDGTDLHLDIVIVERNLTQACDIGYAYNQLAIYDLAHGCDINLTRDYGYSISLNRYGHVVIFRSYVTLDGNIRHDMTVDSVYIQHDLDVATVRELLPESERSDFDNGWEVFVPDSVPVAGTFAEYFAD